MYPYTQNTGSLLNVIKAIGSHGVPAKFSTRELPIWGFKSSNDRSIPNVLKFIGFLDNGGAPQDGWKHARTDAPRAVALGVLAGYSELFQTFPNAHRKDSEALTNFFKAKTTVGDAVIKQMVNTFKALAQFGNFDDSEPSTASTPPRPDTGNPPPQAENQKTAEIPGHPAAGMTINLNIELSLPIDATGEVYDRFFLAMKKHILDAQS